MQPETQDLPREIAGNAVYDLWRMLYRNIPGKFKFTVNSRVGLAHDDDPGPAASPTARTPRDSGPGPRRPPRPPAKPEL